MENTDTNTSIDSGKDDLIPDFKDFASKQSPDLIQENTNSTNIDAVEMTLSEELSETKTQLETANGKLATQVAINGDQTRLISRLNTDLEKNNITAKDYEKEIVANSDNHLTIDPSELEIEPSFHNRNPEFYRIGGSLKTWLIESLNNNGQVDTTKGDIYENEFAKLIRSIYIEGRNNQPIAFRIIKNDNIEKKVIIFGETRWRAVSWLKKNGFSKNNSRNVVLYAFHLEKGDDDSAYQKSKIDENIQRADLSFLDFCIQISQKFQIHVKEFEQNKVPREKNQRAEGYAFKQLSLLTGKGEASIKKIKLIGSSLSQFPSLIGVYGLHLKQEPLSLLASRALKLVPNMLASALVEHLDETSKNAGFDITSIYMPNNTKTTFISKATVKFINDRFPSEQTKKEPRKTENKKNVLTQSVECINKIRLNLEFEDSKIGSEKLREILKDEEKLEEMFNDFLKQYLE